VSNGNGPADTAAGVGLRGGGSADAVGGASVHQTLNKFLAEASFDRWIEGRCAAYYEQTEKRGKPSLAPGVYFRMLLVSHFENLDSQRGIAWRCSDCLPLRAFLGVPLGE